MVKLAEYSKSSSYIVKQKGLGRVFSREPHNLTSIHSYTHSGLVNDKSVGIQPNADGKGIVLSTKKQNVSPGQIKGSRNVKVIKSGGSRRAAGVVANVIGKSGYRSDLLKRESQSSLLNVEEETRTCWEGLWGDRAGRGKGGAETQRARTLRTRSAMALLMDGQGV